MNTSTDTDVLVIGAGPVGMLLAAELALAGARALVVERLAEPNPDRKARTIGPLATEALRRRGLGPEIAKFHEQGTADLRRDHGSERGHFAHIHKVDLTPTDEPDRTRALIWQPDLERVLTKHAEALGVTVRRGSTLTELHTGDDSVTALVDGSEISARYLVGCDGGRSTVRKLAGFEFPGTPPLSITRAGEVELADWTVLPPPGRLADGQLMYGGSLMGTTEYGPAVAALESKDAPLTVDELTASVRRVCGVDVTITSLRNPRRFLDHARQASTYRRGRVLLAGDAAHVHSPNGGQGLNLGLMDALNLGWKLAATVLGRAPDTLLDSYTAERHPVGEAVLNNTRAQSALLAPGPHTDALRDIMSDLMDLPSVNAYFGQLMTGLHTRYALPYPDAAHPDTGRHLADFAVDDTTLYELAGQGHPLLVHTDPAIARIAAPWASAVDVIGATTLGRDDLSAALVRPDGVLAWAALGPAEPELLRGALRCWFGPGR
ncbi:FAD-dependent monooxygenase [Pseudonocardia spinosispora]|uniref:FAD-dependent monooxygenase n=1 Tax=Pseudonocardia spinosispora TaxID=103441 RepID=UPI00040393A3|nr:FAD-dependent monooxygenase [Pseudonocardia spinosispora]